MQFSIFPFSASSWTIVPVGCYRDSYVKPRPLPELIAKFRDTIDRKDVNKTIRACAEKARERGFKFFGIQFYTLCWSGTGAEKTYGRDGVSVDCKDGVGKSGANFVYRFSDYGKHETRLVYFYLRRTPSSRHQLSVIVREVSRRLKRV